MVLLDPQGAGAVPGDFPVVGIERPVGAVQLRGHEELRPPLVDPFHPLNGPRQGGVGEPADVVGPQADAVPRLEFVHVVPGEVHDGKVQDAPHIGIPNVLEGVNPHVPHLDEPLAGAVVTDVEPIAESGDGRGVVVVNRLLDVGEDVRPAAEGAELPVAPGSAVGIHPPDLQLHQGVLSPVGPRKPHLAGEHGVSLRGAHPRQVDQVRPRGETGHLDPRPGGEVPVVQPLELVPAQGEERPQRFIQGRDVHVVLGGDDVPPVRGVEGGGPPLQAREPDLEGGDLLEGVMLLRVQVRGVQGRAGIDEGVVTRWKLHGQLAHELGVRSPVAVVENGFPGRIRSQGRGRDEVGQRSRHPVNLHLLLTLVGLQKLHRHLGFLGEVEVAAEDAGGVGGPNPLNARLGADFDVVRPGLDVAVPIVEGLVTEGKLGHLRPGQPDGVPGAHEPVGYLVGPRRPLTPDRRPTRVPQPERLVGVGGVGDRRPDDVRVESREVRPDDVTGERRGRIGGGEAHAVHVGPVHPQVLDLAYRVGKKRPRQLVTRPRRGFVAPDPLVDPAQ